ncbi:MAG: RNA-protein complex protein Nop10 [Nitrososphaerota archaeon]
MGKLLRKCPRCCVYTLERLCPKCGSETISPHPPSFSLDDKYLLYRIPQRYQEAKE